MSVWITTCTMDEVPHLSKEAKRDLWASTPPYLRDARIKGIPVLGSGLIYPIPQDDLMVKAFVIPPGWPRVFGMDVGWNKTAVGWFARNPESKMVYFYDFHYQGREEPAIHVEAIKARGAWIPGVIDPRSDGRSQIDGKQLFRMYTQDYHLDLTKADNAITTGISKVWQMMVGGMLKVFDTITPFWKEIRMYQTDQDGQVVKKDDHILDLTRYVVASGLDRMRTSNGVSDSRSRYLEVFLGRSGNRRGLSWMAG